MKTLRRLFRRLTSWSTSTRDEELLRAEFEEHIAMQTAENLRAGLSPIEARRQALLKFGSVEGIKDAYRDQRGLPLLETLSRDTRHAIRGLRRTPAFTAAVILTLALGIGANTAVFAVIDSILIQPLPYPQAEALVGVWHTAPGVPGAGTIGCTPSMYFTYREENKTFEYFGLWRSGDASVTGIADPELLRVLLVTHGVLDAVGVKPLLGRWFSRADDTPGSAETVMLTYGYWQRRFGGDTSILGRTLTIESRPRAVIGVMPEDFSFRGDPELILPLRLDRNTLSLGLFNHQGIARLKPGVSLEQANADVARMLAVSLNAWPPSPGMDRTVFQDARFSPRLQSLKQDIVGDIGTALWVIMGTLGLVLLIACANVANLLLVRAEARQQELAIRAALGAGWGRIARALLVESMTLGLLGGAVGLGLAYGALRILVAKGPDTLPRLRDIGIDPVVLAFTLGVSLLSGVLFGVIPVVKYAGPRLATALRGSAERSATAGNATGRVTRWSWRSGTRARAVDRLWPDASHGSTLAPRAAGIYAPRRGPDHAFDDPAHGCKGARARDADAARDAGEARGHSRRHVGGIGQRRAAGISRQSRQPGVCRGQDVRGRPGSPVRRIRKVTPGFFETMGTRVVAGRDFTWTDLYEKRRVAIVSENLAREWWGDPRAALGKRIREARRRRSLARNRGRCRKRLRRRRAREAARVRILAGPDGPIHLGRRKRIRPELRHLRDPLQPDGNGASVGRGAASDVVREWQASGVPRHHTQGALRPVHGTDVVYARDAGHRRGMGLVLASWDLWRDRLRGVERIRGSASEQHWARGRLDYWECSCAMVCGFVGLEPPWGSWLLPDSPSDVVFVVRRHCT